MSIDIDWPRLTTGPEGVELADSIRDFIHDKFQQVELPRFIRSVHVHGFDFGDECPSVDIKDFGDPWAEFYEDEEEACTSEGDEDGMGQVEGQPKDLTKGARDVHQGSERARPDPFKKPKRPSESSLDGAAVMRPSYRYLKPSYIDAQQPLSSHRTHPAFPHSETPFLSGSNTPGIPGGTSNLSYFHLPLSGGLRSGTQTPLAAAFGPSSLEHHTRSPSPVRTNQPTQTGHWDVNSRPSTGYSNSHAQGLKGEEERTTATAIASDSAQDQERDDRSNDLQTTLHITYSGNLSLSLTAEILLDYPMPSFVGIPLTLKITGLSFDGVALLAYMRPRLQRQRAESRRRRGSDGSDESKGRCHFCFLAPEDARVVIGDSRGGLGEDGEGGAGKGQGRRGEQGLGGLLREIRVETEIGRQENGKQVLKNVGKVEKFVLEQVRRIFEEEFVWPSFWTFLV